MFIRRALALILAILWLWPAGVYAQPYQVPDELIGSTRLT